MRDTAPLRSTHRSASDGPADGFIGADALPEWESEELIAARLTLGSQRSHRWLGVLIAIAVGIVGFGFVGQWTGASSQPATAATTCPLVAATGPKPVLDSAPLLLG